MTNQLKLRNSMRFELLHDSAKGSGAAWRCEVSPSQNPVAQICRWPSDLYIWTISGRGWLRFDNDNDEVVSLAIPNLVYVPANTRFIIKNEVRETWNILFVLAGDTGSESFLNMLSSTTDELQLAKIAESMNLELYLPEPEPDLSRAMRAAENRITYPLNTPFSI